MSRLQEWFIKLKKKLFQEAKKDAVFDYPLKKRLIALAAIVVVASAAGSISSSMFWDDVNKGEPVTSKHDTSKSIHKSETVYVSTDENGKPLSTLVEAYLKNNQNSKVIRDKTTLKNIENTEQRENVPKKNSDGTVSWKADGNDISYRGEGRTKDLPVSVTEEYYLNGKRIDNIDVAGVSGDLKIVLKYKSKDTTVVNGKPVHVPYMAMSAVTFKNDFVDIHVSNGRVLETGSTSIVIASAMPGASELLGNKMLSGTGETVTITGKARSFSKRQIVTCMNGDFLTAVDNDTLTNMNFDDSVDMVDEIARKILAISNKAVAAVRIVDQTVMPALENTTTSISQNADRLVKKTPSALKTIKDTAGSTAAKADIVLYTISSVKDLITDYSKKYKDVSDAEAAQLISDYLNGYTDGSGQKVKGLSTEIEENIAKEEKAIEELKKSDPDYEESVVYKALYDSVESQKKILEDLTGTDQKKGLNEAASFAAEYQKDSGEAIQKIDDMLYESDWITKEIKKGNVAEYAGPKDAKLMKEYADGLKKKDGSYKAVSKILNNVPYSTGKLYKAVDKAMSKKNQESVINVLKSVADGIRTVDSVTYKVGDVVSKVSSGTETVSDRMTELYKKYFLRMMNMYNSNIRGITDRIELLRTAEEQASVYSGISSDMEGSSTYMFITPVGSSY